LNIIIIIIIIIIVIKSDFKVSDSTMTPIFNSWNLSKESRNIVGSHVRHKCQVKWS